VEVQLEDLVLALAQWVKQNAEKQLHVFASHIGVQMAMKLNPLLPKMEQLKFQQNGIVLDVVFQRAETRTSHRCL
jgi:hypothetical protein